MPNSADAAWFTFACQGADFAVYAFEGAEEVCEPYEFAIELVSRSSGADLTSLLGTEACLAILDRSGGVRHVHGLIRHMEQLHTANSFTHYRCLLVPRLWFASLKIEHRIFQNSSVPDIIESVLSAYGFAAGGVEFKLFHDYEPREYCVQYGETDLAFISRLCEEEGIYFYFEHTAAGHTLCFCDREGGPSISGESVLRFYAGSGQTADTAVIRELTLCGRVNSNAAAYREWNFEKPKLFLGVGEMEAAHAAAPVPKGMLLEQYRYPHIYQLRGEGERYAQIQLGRQLVYREYVDIKSDVSRFVPSFTFTVVSHPRPAANAAWWTVRVEHRGEQPGVLEHEAPGRGMSYESRVRAIPQATRFVPELRHPKRLVIGQQTAIVTGPEGEEIYPDEYGRVKVQFFWDREDKWNEKTTCWIRVSQGWAGGEYGLMAIPRIGHEVIVSFVNGDPDRPIVTGRVYHKLNMPPYELPAHKTRTVFKSMSTPGEEGVQRGFNEFRIEDKAGEEEIFVHAEKDVNVHVKNDWKEHILHDRHRTVDNFSYGQIKGEDHQTVDLDRKVELFADDHLTVHNDSHFAINNSWLGKVGQEIHLKAGQKVVIEAGSEITLKGGGAFIKLTPAGVTFNGAEINLNSGGSPGSGSGAAPLLPEDAAIPAPPPPPPSPECMYMTGTERFAMCNEGGER